MSDWISPLLSEGSTGQRIVVVGLTSKQKKGCTVRLGRNHSVCPAGFYKKTESVLPLCVVWIHRHQSLNWFAGASSVFLYKAVFWLTHRYRKQRSAAQGMWSFLSSSLVTISCKENRNVTKKVWPEEGSSRRKWCLPACLPLCQHRACVARLVIALVVGFNFARWHWWKRPF